MFNSLSRLFLEAQAAHFHIGHAVSPNDGRLGLHGDVVVGPLAAVARLMAGVILHAHAVVGSCQQQIDEHDYDKRIISSIIICLRYCENLLHLLDHPYSYTLTKLVNTTTLASHRH